MPRFLLSEALRGEGAWLVNAAGERFMHRYHPLLELAPRDVVARAITREGMGARPGEVLPVYLDMRHVTGIDLDARFPGISAFLHQHGLDLARDLIPVRPAAHYLMGGVRTDVDGRTSLRRPVCRWRSGMYRGARREPAGEQLAAGRAGLWRPRRGEPCAGKRRPAKTLRRGHRSRASDRSLPPVEEAIRRLQQQMWEHAGLLRDAELLRGIDLTAAMAYAEAIPPARWTRREYEARSLARVARAIVVCALAREESRGAHYPK